MENYKFYNRELSWLSFNYRVLQEAEDPSVPLYERIKFLSIFSSNLDEFFRVRVASLRSLLSLKKKTQKELDFDVKKLLNRIYKAVVSMQEEYGSTFREKIIPDLEKENIFVVDHTQLNEVQKAFSKEFFNEQIQPHIMPVTLVKKRVITFLRNQRLYLAVKLSSKLQKKKDLENKSARKRFIYAIVEIPTNHVSRFVTLPKVGDRNYVILLDDIMRLFLPQIFYGYNIHESFALKLTRDAELYIEDEFTGSILEKIKKSLSKRSSGVPCRFLYDSGMPASFLKFLKESLLLVKEDLYPGGRYHNFSDFMDFPNPGIKDLNYAPLVPLHNLSYDKCGNVFDCVSGGDYLFYFPFQSYDYVVDAIRAASNDPSVTSIKITEYRVARNSSIVNSLISAAHRGKEVTAFVEIKARFDEEINIKSAEEMQKAGVKVLYSLPGLKVHAKMAMITRMEDGAEKNYVYLATGNFNEKTARLYTDFGFFTKDERLTNEVAKVFNFLEGKIEEPEFEHLLVAQFNMRKSFTKMIEREIENANNGLRAEITIKLNSLEDERMIKKLYDASNAGVKIRIIVRGICCLIPGVEGMSENIKAISIIDKFLEHSRVYIFHNNGDETIYLSSADWMSRNLSRRIESAFPIYNETLKKIVKDIIEIQWSDNVKARIIDEKQTNKFRETNSPHKIRSQEAICDYLQNNIYEPALTILKS